MLSVHFNDFVKVSISLVKLGEIKNTVEVKESLDKIWCCIIIERFLLLEDCGIDRRGGRLRPSKTLDPDAK